MTLFTPGPFRWKSWIGERSETVIRYTPGRSVFTGRPPCLRWIQKPGPTVPCNLGGADQARPVATAAAVADAAMSETAIGFLPS
jgi:hypothetical protein